MAQPPMIAIKISPNFEFLKVEHTITRAILIEIRVLDIDIFYNLYN